jgi:hypothetical protein
LKELRTLRRFSFMYPINIEQRGPSTCQQYRMLNRTNHEAFVWRLRHMHCFDVHDESNDCTIVSFIRDWCVSKTVKRGPLSS